MFFQRLADLRIDSDKTPPELVTGFVTDKGIYDGDKLWDYYNGDDGTGEYELIV